MNILLVGEYSRLHNSLKEGLQRAGHHVVLISTGDAFKKYPSDILLKRKYDSGFLRKIKIGLYRIFRINITSLSLRNQFFKHREKLKGFDVVQLINESPFGMEPVYEKQIISFLLKNNRKLFLLSCGADHISIRYAYDKKMKYSILSPLFEGKAKEKDYQPALRYLDSQHQDLHNFLYENIRGVLASDMDYVLPLEGNKKFLGLVPNPVNTDKLTYQPVNIRDRIVIFLGINRTNYFKKGSDLFEAALERIAEKYPEKVEIIIVEDLPYKEYIQKYRSAHILLDQVYSYDQGYNALEAMACGKVVFTGAETEFLDYYNLKEDEVCINSIPDVDFLVKKLEFLILNPEKIVAISENAVQFIEKEHHYLSVAKKYLSLWKDN